MTEMYEMHETPQAYPRLRTWVSGLAVGLAAATFAWVQWAPDTVRTEAAGDSRDDVTAPLETRGTSEEEATDGGQGGQTVRRVTRGGGGGTGGGGDGPGGGGAATDFDVGGGIDGQGQGGPTGGGDQTAGITGDRIKLGATVAEGGIAKAFLGEVRLGMEAVRSRVNGAGGIHGRQLDIDYKNDDWDPGRGKRNIENLISDGVFAFAVSPSSEGLNEASKAGVFAKHGVPVIGADGLNNSQFVNLQTGEPNQWIWPVASATTTQVHVIMKNAYERCESNPDCPELRPAIVFGNTYRFGVEGSYAFNEAYRELSGKEIDGFSKGGTTCSKRFCGVEGGKNQYPSEVNQVQSACGGPEPCNFVLLLLEPASAVAWMKNFKPASSWAPDGGCCGMAGAQPLFTTDFAAKGCKEKCDGMVVWTGYNPPAGYDDRPEVAQYKQELRGQSSRADVDNQFTLGGYIGMTLLVEALEAAGRDLTRDKLVATLNSMPPLKTGLTAPEGLKWSESQRYANQWAQGFAIEYTTTFGGFKLATGGYVKDDWVGQHNR